MYRIIVALVAVAIAFGVVKSQNGKATPSSINEATLKAHIKFLSDDLLEGRGLFVLVHSSVSWFSGVRTVSASRIFPSHAGISGRATHLPC